MKYLTPINIIRFLCAAAVITIAIILLVAKKPWDILAEIGKPSKVEHYVTIYSWWAGAANALIFLALGALTPWWFRSAPVDPAPWLAPQKAPRWFWPLVLLAMAVTTFCGLQRISYSLWDDEENSVRRVIVGKYRDERPFRMKEADWEDAFWNYRLPTNHQLQTILSKSSLHVWQAIARPTGLQFTEPAMRWPILVAAVLSVGALALLLHRLGFSRAAVVAAFLLALHPWHIRYAVELRGYMLTLLLVPLTVYFLLQAINTSRWRWWLGFAAAEFLLLYAYPGTLYVLVAANACGLIALWFRHDRDGRLSAIPRLLVASTLAGMVYLQLMGPCIPQLMEYFQTDRALGSLSPRWHLNMAAHLVSGIPWNNSDAQDAGYLELLWITGNRGWVPTVLFGGAGLLCAIGIIRLVARRPAGWLAAVVTLLPALVVYLMARQNNQYLYEWYIIFVLPGLCAVTALAVEWPTRLLDDKPPGRIVTPIFLGAAIGLFFLLTEPARNWFLQHSIQPIKDAVLTVRSSLDPNDPKQDDIVTVSLGVHALTYDPNVLSAIDPPTLTRLAVEADQADKPLYLITGNDLAVAVDYPELREMFRNPRFFEPVTVIKGLDPTLTQYIWVYRPGSLPAETP